MGSMYCPTFTQAAFSSEACFLKYSSSAWTGVRYPRNEGNRMGTGGHNVPIIRDKYGIRKLTPRECARFQGFSEDFILPDHIAKSHLYKQIGNSVSVPVITRIALNIFDILHQISKNTISMHIV